MVLRTMHVATWELPAALSELSGCEVQSPDVQGDVVFINYIDDPRVPRPIIIEPDFDEEDMREFPAVMRPDYVAPAGDDASGVSDDTQEAA